MHLIRCWVPIVEHARTGGQEVHSPPHPFGSTRLTCPFSSQNSLQRALPAGARIFPLHRFDPSPPPQKRGGKGTGKVGDRGEEDVCQSWKKHELCQVSKTNLNLSIAVLIPYPEAGSHPRRKLNVVTKGACLTLILFGGPGETKSNFTIV